MVRISEAVRISQGPRLLIGSYTSPEAMKGWAIESKEAGAPRVCIILCPRDADYF